MTSHIPAISFVKASACGNDFLVIDGSSASGNFADLTRRLCNRHQGVGADGVEWLFPDQSVDVHARLFNADGSEAEISGNGTRCVAAYLCAQTRKEKIVIRTGAGLKTCVLTSRSDTRYEFETDMGEPEVRGHVSVLTLGREVKAVSVSMGNPHLDIFVDDFSSQWQSEAAEIARHSGFPQGVNIEFIKIRDRNNIEVRFFERGVGETQSSGTGSSAAAVASIFAGHADSLMQVHATGGTQSVRWEKQVFLRGPAQLVASGEFFLPEM